jgi:WD40 repeat protein
MRLPLSHAWVIGIFCLLPLNVSAETGPDALPPGAVARLGWSPLRIGYSDFTLTPDGRTIVVVTPQGNFRRLDAKTGRLLERRQLSDRGDVDIGDGTVVHPAVLSANGETVVLYEPTYKGPRLTVYDVASGKMIFRRASTGTKHIQFGRFSPDGKQLVVAEYEDVPQETVIADEKQQRRTFLRLIDLKSKQIRELAALPPRMVDMVFSADGKHLLVTQQDLVQIRLSSSIHFGGQPVPHMLTVFDLPSGKKLWRRTVWGMNFAVNRDGTMVLVSGMSTKDGGWKFIPEDCRCATGFHVLQMDIDAKKLTEQFVPCKLNSDVFPNLHNIVAFALAPDDRTLVISHFDGHGGAHIVSWDLRTCKEIRRFKLPPTKGAQLIPPKLAVSADGRTLLTCNEYLQRWDLATGKPFFAPPPDDSLPGSLMQLAFTPDGKELFASSLGGVSGRWNLATGKRVDLIHDHYGGVPFVRTPEGLRTIWPDDSKAPSWFAFAILDPISRKTLHTIRYSEPNQSAQAYTLTASGKTLLSIHPGKKLNHVTAWHVATGRKLSHFTRSGALSFPRSPFSPCGRWVILIGEIYHLGSGTKLFAPAGSPNEQLPHGPVWFSEDGRLMGAHLRKSETKTEEEDTLAVWELASGKVLARFPKAGFVAQVAFAPDGRTIALLDAQGVRLEDLLSGKRLGMYPAPDVICGSAGYAGEIHGLVFAPDGSTLATGHQDGSIVLWKVPQSNEIKPTALTDGEEEKLRGDLGSSSPATARAAVDRLACHPDAAIAMLETRFRPPPADAQLAALINDLDSEAFATREEAARKLRAYGARAEAALRRTLAKAPSLEMRRRIEGILAEMAPPALRLPLSGERLRGVRAIEVLERIDNAAALRLLHSWAEQTEDIHLAIEARLALERSAAETKKSP